MNIKNLSSRLEDEPGLILFISPKIINEIIEKGFNMHVDLEINPHRHRHEFLFRSFYRNDSLVRDFLKSYACYKDLEEKLSKSKFHPTAFEIQQAIAKLYNI